MGITILLAVVVFSAALVASIYLICKYGITIHRTTEDLTKPFERAPIETTDDKPKENEPIAMDAVIQAANALMGIVPEEKEDN